MEIDHFDLLKSLYASKIKNKRGAFIPTSSPVVAKAIIRLVDLYLRPG